MSIFKQITIRAKKLFYGWWIVAAGSALYFLGIGSVFYGFNVFFNPMIAEFGWSRAVTSGAYSLCFLQGAVLGPVAGWLIDKFGARKLIFLGVILTGIGFIALILVRSVWSFYIIFGGILALGFNSGFYPPITAAAANWFLRKRSRALSIIVAGGGIGGGIIVPFMAWLITQFSWRIAAVIMGALVLIIGIPLASMMRDKPEDEGLLPDGEESFPNSGLTTVTQTGASRELFSSNITIEEVNFTVGEAVRTSSFWMFMTALLLRAAILSSLVVHQIPHLVDIGISYQAASAALGLMIMISVPGKLIFGWLGDIFDKRLLIFITSLLQALGLWVLIYAHNLEMAYIYVIIFGIGYGGEIPLVVALRGDLFGRKTFATLGGIAAAITGIAPVVGPVFAGYLYDVTRSYSLAFYIFMALITVSGILFLLVKPTQQSPPSESASMNPTLHEGI